MSIRANSSKDIVDFNSLVWPPPELRPPASPKPIIVHTANNATYKVYPGQSFSEARRLAGIQRSGSEGSSTIDDEEFDQKQMPSSSRYPLIDNRPPSRPASAQPSTNTQLANGPVEHKSKGRYGCKDFPAGYSPTPRPLSPQGRRPYNSGSVRSNPSSFRPRGMPQSAAVVPTPMSQHHYPSTSPQPRSGRTSTMNFFEPLEPIPQPVNENQEDFISPVMENGRIVSMCRIPGNLGLSPGGHIEKGWVSDSSSARTLDTNRNSYWARSSGTSNTSPRVAQHSPYSQTSPKPFSPYATPPPNRRYTLEDEQAIQKTIQPTRKGFWNRRGDTLSADGRIVPAYGSLAYPPDLAHYPQHALMNEKGKILLPENGDDKVSYWRIGASK